MLHDMFEILLFKNVKHSILQDFQCSPTVRIKLFFFVFTTDHYQ